MYLDLGVSVYVKGSILTHYMRKGCLWVEWPLREQQIYVEDHKNVILECNS